MPESPKDFLKQRSRSLQEWRKHLHEALTEAQKDWKGDPDDVIGLLIAAGWLPAPDDLPGDRFKEERESWGHCNKCGHETKYVPKFDACYCRRCGVWQEPKCDNPDCGLCRNRPVEA